MASVSDLNIRLGLITRDFDRNLAKVERDLRNSGRRLSTLGDDLTIAISAPLAAFGYASIKAAGDTESLTLALEDQIKSAEGARKEYELLRKEALKPGLGLEQALRGSVALQAVGFQAEKARKTLSLYGNALALAGKGKAELDGVVLALTQISAKGKISAEEINQIAERLPQIRTLMKQAFGTADTEALQKLGITSEQFIDKINTELEKLPEATGGIKNTIENIGDAVKQYLTGIGLEINKAFDIKKVGEDIQRVLGESLQWFQRLDDGTKRTIVQFGLVLVAAGPLVKLFGALYGGAAQLVGVFRSVVAASAPLLTFFAGMTQSTASVTGYIGDFAKGLLGAGNAAIRMRVAILAATGGLAAIMLGIAGAVFLLTDRFDAAGFATKQFNEAHKTTIDQAAKETAALNKNFDILRNVTTGTDDRKKAISALQAAYPDYIRNIDLEKASAADLTKIQKNLNDQILRGVAERQKAAAVTAIYEKQAQILLRIQEIQRTGKTTTGENTLIDTGDMIRNGSRAAAIIEKLQAQVKDLGTQANISAQDFDKAFGLQNRAIDPLLEKQYDARQAAEDLRSEYSALGGTLDNNTRKTKEFANATGAAGDGLSKKMKTALAAVNANLTAFDEKLKLYGPSAETAEQKNDLLAKSIDKLLKAGFSATSTQVQNLKDELSASTVITDQAKEAYRKLREEWSKPIDIKPAAPAVPGLPQANPMGVGPQPAGNAATQPVDIISVGALNEALVAINALTVGLQNLQTVGLTPTQALMQGIQDQSITFGEAWTALGEKVAQGGKLMEQVAFAASGAMQQAALDGQASFKSLAAAALKAASQVVKAYIMEGVAAAVAQVLSSVPPPYGLILAGAAGAAAGALFQGLINKITAPKLAGGGVITKPTFAMLGEYPGAGSNPEIAAPESKIRSIFRSEQRGGGPTELYSIVRGDDILLVSEKAATRRGRVR